MLRIYDYAHVPRPDNQVTRLWRFNPHKIFTASIEFERGGVRVRQPCKTVDFVNEVGAIGFVSKALLVFRRGRHNRVALFLRQHPDGEGSFLGPMDSVQTKDGEK
ncbi:MAG: hypothetical protein AAB037_01855 [Chloroflexota bacterium]